jgi:predicted NBD/HSP70 family sugar kinase
MTGTGAVVGLDVGGTKTLAILVDASGHQLAIHRQATASGAAGELLDSIAAAVVSVTGQASIEPAELDGVGIGVPGIVDPVTGDVRHAVNLGIGADAVPLVRQLEQTLNTAVAADNDANSAALGAARLLDADDLAYLSIGTGVAVGLVLDGELRRGWRGAAGELGHLPVDPEGPWCECGQRGCLEVVASGPAIARRWPATDGGSPVAALFDAAATGDRDAVAQRERLAGHLAAAVTMTGLTVDPRLIVLGGGVSEVGPPLVEAVGLVLQRRAGPSGLLADLDLAGRLVVVPGGVSAGAVGAVELVRSMAVARR